MHKPDHQGFRSAFELLCVGDMTCRGCDGTHALATIVADGCLTLPHWFALSGAVWQHTMLELLTLCGVGKHDEPCTPVKDADVWQLKGARMRLGHTVHMDNQR